MSEQNIILIKIFILFYLLLLLSLLLLLFESLLLLTAQKLKFLIEDFFIFSAVIVKVKIDARQEERLMKKLIASIFSKCQA